MDMLTCGICLDALRVPVCTPCGHLCCEACLTSYIETSADALTASCPTCRSPFPITIPDLRVVPKKYHSFIIPSIRRLFIPTDDDAPEQAGPSQSRRDLVTQIAALNEKIAGLMSDKILLIDRCEAALRASGAHAQGERDERLNKERLARDKKQIEREKEKLARDTRELQKKYECLKSKYKALKASQENAAPKQSMVLSMKRKSANSPGHELASDAEGDMRAHRPQRHIPKRPRLLGSPFDLTKRVATRSKSTRTSVRQTSTRSRMLIDEDDLHDSDFEPVLDVSSSSSAGPQHSGLPTGDLFSPGPSISARGSLSRGMRSVDFVFEGPSARLRTREPLLGGGLRPAWLLSPEETIE